MPTPFTNLPLKTKPYYSRVSTTTFNYPLIAYTPGYALQASELNEIQETFYLQQTLSNELLQNWPLTGTTGLVSASLRFPMWSGAVPLLPSQVTYVSGIVTVNAGWYLVTLPSNNLKIWLYKPDNNTANISTGNSVGLVITTSFIPCSPVSGTEGYAFNDNSNGSINDNSCGAHRYKIEISNILQISTNPTYPIARAITSGSTTVVEYLNNLKIG